MMDRSGQSILSRRDQAVLDGSARAPSEDDVEARIEALVAQRLAERLAGQAQSEEHHRHIIESLPGGVIHIASDGTFQRANAEAVRFLGRPLEELMHQTLPDYSGTAFNEDGTPCPVEDFSASKCLATGRPQGPRTLGIRRPDGTMVWAVFTSLPIPCPLHAGRLGTVVTFLNITERKLAEETLRHAREDLERRVAERTAELARSNELLRDEIAERIRADAALRESEARFRQITEN